MGHRDKSVRRWAEEEERGGAALTRTQARKMEGKERWVWGPPEDQTDPSSKG